MNAVKFLSGPSPVMRHNVSFQVKKGEDFYLEEPNCRRGGMEFGVYCVFDGHNGTGAAMHVKEKLLDEIFVHLPDGRDKDLWLKSLPLAMAEAFMKLNNDIEKLGENSGTTVTMVVVTGWTVTVGAVGDSRAILDTAAGGVTLLSVDHRFEDNSEEVNRVTNSGGKIARLKSFEGIELGPLRSWPGGLCVSRSVGDIECGPGITPLPHVKQVEVPRSGGRIIMASDGLWDAVDSNRAAKCTQGIPSAKAANQLVKESIKSKGLRDDITVIVVDFLPSGTNPADEGACPVPSKPKKGVFSRMKASIGGKKVENVVASSVSDEELPNLVNDHDSIKGGNLYERYLRGGSGVSIHSGGLFCSICGVQVADNGSNAEASVRGGTVFCADHLGQVPSAGG